MNFSLFVLEILVLEVALAYGSSCFTCRPHFALRTAPDTLI